MRYSHQMCADFRCERFSVRMNLYRKKHLFDVDFLWVRNFVHLKQQRRRKFGRRQVKSARNLHNINGFVKLTAEKVCFLFMRILICLFSALKCGNTMDFVLILCNLCIQQKNWILFSIFRILPMFRRFYFRVQCDFLRSPSRNYISWTLLLSIWNWTHKLFNGLNIRSVHFILWAICLCCDDINLGVVCAPVLPVCIRSAS